MAPEPPENTGSPDNQPPGRKGAGPSSDGPGERSGASERSQLPGPTLPRGGGAIHPTDEKYDVDLAPFLPALAFWVFDNIEDHPKIMRLMDSRESFALGDYRFTLAASDPDTSVGVYLIELVSDTIPPRS